MTASVGTEPSPPPLVGHAEQSDQQPERLDALVLRQIDDLCQLLGQVPPYDQHDRGAGGPDPCLADSLRPVLDEGAGLDTEARQATRDFELLGAVQAPEPVDALIKRTDDDRRARDGGGEGADDLLGLAFPHLVNGRR